MTEGLAALTSRGVLALVHIAYRKPASSKCSCNNMITCIGDHGSKYRYRHITSVCQVVYVQRIRCSKNSP
jgi:hypothetical protein